MSRPHYRVPSALEGISWPAISAPKSASMLALQFQLEQSQWWPAERLIKEQLKQAQLLLAHAVATVPYYREHAGFTGLEPHSPLSMAGWQQLPLLDRESIQTAGKRLVSEALPKSHGQLLSYSTSGSTGRPLQGFDTEVTRFFWGGFNLREHLWHRRDLDACFAAIRTKVKQAQHKSWGGAVSVAFKTGPAATLNINTPVTQQLKWLNRIKPAYLLSHASNLRALARAAIQDNRNCPSLRQLISFGEMLPPDLRQLCAEAWPSAPLVDMYSSEELGYLALQCPEQPHYHVQSENLLLEVLNDQNEPCDVGEVGRVAVTTLHNFGMPLIRYLNGDYAELGPPCPCGRGLPVLSRILGRQRNMLIRPDGSQHWPSFPAESWLNIAPFQQFRLIQKQRDHIEVEYVIEQELTAVEKDNLIRTLQSDLNFPHQISLVRQPKISLSPNHKYEDFVSEIA